MDYASMFEVEQEMMNHKSIYIYGAGVVAGGVADAIAYLYDIMPVGYLVSDTLDRCKLDLSEDILIVIATPEQYHADIIQALNDNGYGDVDRICITSHLEYLLMSKYLKKKSGLLSVDDCKVEENVNSLDIYIAEACSNKDLHLNNQYETEKFVNKVFCDQVECPLDNSIYGEMSAIWWMHKNEQHDIMGLYHYRRDLLLNEKDLSVLTNGEADVIMPLPYVCDPDTSGQYRRYLQVKDQQVMWDVLKKRYPDFCEKSKSILEGNNLYNHNIIVARKEVFNAYCDWIFPILEEIAKECETESRPGRMTRYIGRIGEVLTSLYFTVNEQKLKVVHGEKRWKV